ncbi:MAG TPA: 2OG-Fe(II) oxygenase [Luteibacter sp.]|jgi:SM-20-related protein|nr:2OG-Fe(II) oxygenase [Luteibacter sp.]
MASTPDAFLTAAAALANHGWCVVTDLLTPSQTRALGDECTQFHDGKLLRPGLIGADRASSLLRGDSTHWFAADAPTAPQRIFGERMEMLRVTLNRELMLGLVDSEAHYAAYPAGAGYARHLDRPRGNDARVVSAVFYLNDAWQAAEGGALRLHMADGSQRDIAPQAGTLVLFLSGDFEHEVLPATRTRLSIACWMRQRARPAL